VAVVSIKKKGGGPEWLQKKANYILLLKINSMQPLVLVQKLGLSGFLKKKETIAISSKYLPYASLYQFLPYSSSIL
jgi:hypothetical protein